MFLRTSVFTLGKVYANLDCRRLLQAAGQLLGMGFSPLSEFAFVIFFAFTLWFCMAPDSSASSAVIPSLLSPVIPKRLAFPVHFLLSF